LEQEAARIEVRRRKALSYHLAGRSYREIAEILDVAVATAHEDVSTMLAEIAQRNNEQLEQERAKEAARLEDALGQMYDQIANVPTMYLYDDKGNIRHNEDGEPLTTPLYKVQHSAVEKFNQLLDRKAKLLGLNMERSDQGGQTLILNIGRGQAGSGKSSVSVAEAGSGSDRG